MTKRRIGIVSRADKKRAFTDAVALVLKTTPGISGPAIKTIVGMPWGVANSLIYLRKRGKAVCVPPGGGMFSVWCLVADLPAVQARRDNERVLRLSIASKLDNKKRYLRLLSQRRPKKIREDESPFVHLLTCARAASPLRPRGPASVWALAA